MLDQRNEHRLAKRKKIWTWLIIAILVFSVGGFLIGFGAGGGGTSQKYNGIKFTSTQGGYIAKIDGVRYGFNYHPYQVEGIFSDDVADLLTQPFIYLSYDPTSEYNQSMAAVQYYLLEFLGDRFDTYVSPATTQDAGFGLPIIDCANATQSEPVIVFIESNITQIQKDGNCALISVENEADIYRVQDRLVFMALGVMQ